MNGGITIDDFDIIFKTSEDSLNGEDDNLGGVVLEGCEVEEEIISVRETKSGGYEVINRLHFKEPKK